MSTAGIHSEANFRSSPVPHRRPELLAPAGSLEMMRAAFAFGADAVYAGQPRYSLRVRNNSFGRIEALAEGLDYARAAGKSFYVVSNIYAHNAKVRTYLADMAPVVALAPDALIMADPGLIHMVRERWPEMPVHLSVQANTVSSAAVRFWRTVGVQRVILSRELSLDEIAEIRQECPETEIEVFVHGALCIAYSGRCLLSGYFSHRDPNQGSCTNSCRWEYRLHPAQEGDTGEVLPLASGCNGADLPLASLDGAQRHPDSVASWLLEEAQRPGELMPIEEDEHGTYILNSRDLRAVEHVARLVEIGVDSLKIEGRTKSPYYVARSCHSYRRAIDDAVAGRDFDYGLLGALEGLANRGYTDGFYQRHHTPDHQNYLRGHSEAGRSLLVGEVIERDACGRIRVEVKNAFAPGDELEFVYPGGMLRKRLEAIEDDAGQPLARAPGSGYRVWIAAPPEIGDGPCYIARLLASSA